MSQTSWCKHCELKLELCSCSAVEGGHWVDYPWAAKGPGQLCRPSVHLCVFDPKRPYGKHESIGEGVQVMDEWGAEEGYETENRKISKMAAFIVGLCAAAALFILLMSLSGCKRDSAIEAPKPSPASPTALLVRPGAFCSEPGALGKSSAGREMMCAMTPEDHTNRWREVA